MPMNELEVSERVGSRGREDADALARVAGARIAALMSSKTLASTPSGLSAAFTRYGPSVPMSTAVRLYRQ